MIEYRKATPADARAMAELRTALIEGDGTMDAQAKAALTNTSEKYFSEAIAKGEFSAFVAEDDGKIICSSGYCIFVLPPLPGNMSGKHAYFSNLYTRPEYRGQGVGTTLFLMTKEAAIADGCERLYMNASPMGRPIYAKHGFGSSGSTMTYVVRK